MNRLHPTPNRVPAPAAVTEYNEAARDVPTVEAIRRLESVIVELTQEIDALRGELRQLHDLRDREIGVTFKETDRVMQQYQEWRSPSEKGSRS